MADSFDIYSDSVTITIGDIGSSLSFQLQEPHPNPVNQKAPNTLGTVRLSNEHLMVLAFMLRRQMKKHQEESGVIPQVPRRVFNQLGVAPEDRDNFWR